MGIDAATPQEWDSLRQPSMQERYDKNQATAKQVGEVFKDISGYEGRYQISSFGRVVSLGNKSNHIESIFLTIAYDKDGYKRVTLQKDKVRRYYRVCRLVAQAFCDNPHEYNIVNHIDEVKSNDYAYNLEWVTSYQNWKHSEASQSFEEIPVIKLDLYGNYICEYNSLMSASRDTGINQGNITNCLQGRCKSVGGYKWLIK